MTEDQRRESISRLARMGMYRHADGYVYKRCSVVCDPARDELIAYGWDRAIQLVLGNRQAA